MSSYIKIGQTNQKTYWDKKVTWGKRYYYKIIAVNENGEEGEAGKKTYKNLKRKQGLVGVVNYHAMGQIIFGRCSRRSIAKDTRKMYQIAKRLTGYRSSAGYKAATPASGGGYRDYVMDHVKVASITIEMGTTSAPCSYWEYNSAFAKNRAVVIKIANALKN